jgi:hypothetical protein
MKSLILAFLLATITLAQAQQLNQPRTIKLHNNKTGENIGTLTVSGNTAYLRDMTGKHQATIVSNSDGTKTYYDYDGKIIDGTSIAIPKLPNDEPAK